MNKFAIVIPYFGIFKPSFLLFLESCNRNPDMDFILFTDCDIPDRVIISSNVKWIKSTLSDIHILAENQLKVSVRLDRPYKMCDLRPFYGIVFKDYLKEYEYWGYGDVDVICGRIVKYLNKICYHKYDKINWMGHMTLIRNDEKCNHAALKEVKGTISADKVFQQENNTGFDERDFNLKCLDCGMKIYSNKWSADIDMFYWRMRCVDIRTLHFLLDTYDIKYAPANYSKQLFAVIDGITYRVYLRNGKVHKEEFAYIHFRKEVPIHFNDLQRVTYIISRNGFEAVESQEFEDYDKVLKLINRYNNQEDWIQEMYCFLYHYWQKISGKRGW